MTAQYFTGFVALVALAWAAFFLGFYIGRTTPPDTSEPEQRRAKRTIDDADQDGFVGTSKVDDDERPL